MSLKTYLQEHFVDKPAFASLLGITVDRLDELIAARAIPEPTYTCDGSSVRSAAFGAIESEEPLSGEYFRPECTRWAKIAGQAAPGKEAKAPPTRAPPSNLSALPLERVPLASPLANSSKDEVVVSPVW